MGLTLNTSNGQITLSSSTAGNYEVIRTVTNTPGSLSTSATDIVTINPADNAAFSYSGSPYDLADASNPTPTVTGLSGGTFSSTRDSFTFNRQGDYIQSSVVTSINSVSLWFKPNSTITTTSSGEVLISFGTTDFRRAVYLGSNFGSINNELITVGDQNANYSYYAQSGGTIDTNWHHLAIVHDGSKYQIYLDGSAITTSGSTPLYSSQQLTIGARGRTGSPPADSYFNGKISNVAIWNSNQSSNISNIYNNGFPQTTYTVTPQQWWKLGGNSTFSSGTWTIPSALPITTTPNYTKAFNFIASDNNYVDFGNNSSLQIVGAITISLWFKTSNTSAQGLIAKGDYFSNAANTGYQLSLLTGQIWFKFSDGTTNVQLSPTVNWSDNNWHNLVAVWDGTTNVNGVKLFFDNLKIAETTSNITSIQNVSDNLIASFNSNGGGGHFDGEMSNFQIFNTALNLTGDNSINTLYNNGTPLTSMTGFSSLQGWWKFDNTSTFSSGQWTIPDSSSNSNTGTSAGTNTSANLITSDVLATQPVNAVSTTLPSTALNSLNINSTTGLISLSSSSIGTFPVTYDTTGATGSLCPATSTQNVQLVNTNFNYPQNNICNATGSPNVTPTNFIQQTGGQFTVTPVLSPGLTIDGTTGVIQPIGANAVTYAITYTIGTNSTTQNITSVDVINPLTTTNTSTLTFNGTSSYIYAEDSSNLRVNGDMTISAWIKFDSNQTGNYQKIINKRDAGGVNYDFYLNNDTIPKIKFFDGSNANDQSTGTITPGSWTHVAITISSGTTNGSTFFIDGVPSGTGTYTITSDDGPLYIGRYYDSPTYGGWWPGEMDEIAIWDRQLTACDINGIYQASSNGSTADLSTVYSSNLKYYNRMGD